MGSGALPLLQAVAHLISLEELALTPGFGVSAGFPRSFRLAVALGVCAAVYYSILAAGGISVWELWV